MTARTDKNTHLVLLEVFETLSFSHLSVSQDWNIDVNNIFKIYFHLSSTVTVWIPIIIDGINDLAEPMSVLFNNIQQQIWISRLVGPQLPAKFQWQISTCTHNWCLIYKDWKKLYNEQTILHQWQNWIQLAKQVNWLI